MCRYHNTKAKVWSLDGDTDFFKILAGVLKRYTIAPYLFIMCLDYVLRTSVDPLIHNGLLLKRRYTRRHPTAYITDADYADDLALLSGTIAGANFLLLVLEQAASEIGLKINAKKTEYLPINCEGIIQTQNDQILKSVDNYSYLGSVISSSEKDIEIRIAKAWTALERSNII